MWIFMVFWGIGLYNGENWWGFIYFDAWPCAAVFGRCSWASWGSSKGFECGLEHVGHADTAMTSFDNLNRIAATEQWLNWNSMNSYTTTWHISFRPPKMVEIGDVSRPAQAGPWRPSSAQRRNWADPAENPLEQAAAWLQRGTRMNVENQWIIYVDISIYIWINNKSGYNFYISIEMSMENMFFSLSSW